MNIDTKIRNIIEKDYKKNHQGREYDFNRMLQVFENFERVGWSSFVNGSVIILYTPYNADTVEFHCHNGGTSKDLVKAVNAFNAEMSKNYSWSITFYDNPKINDLLVHTDFPCEYSKIDKGIDETYQTTFKLRNK